MSRCQLYFNHVTSWIALVRRKVQDISCASHFPRESTLEHWTQSKSRMTLKCTGLSSGTSRRRRTHFQRGCSVKQIRSMMCLWPQSDPMSESCDVRDWSMSDTCNARGGSVSKLCRQRVINVSELWRQRVISVKRCSVLQWSVQESCNVI